MLEARAYQPGDLGNNLQGFAKPFGICMQRRGDKLYTPASEAARG